MQPPLSSSASGVPASPEQRKAALDAWVSQQLGQPLSGEVASADASFRRYFRYRWQEADGEHSLIAMDAPPVLEDCRPFIRIAGLFADAGVHVPHIIAQDLQQGFLLLPDMGTETWLHTLNDNNADAKFALAIRDLIRIQRISQPNVLPVYDDTLLRRELQLFPDWYLQKHLQIDPAPFQPLLNDIFNVLVSRALSQQQVYVHRDFMPRNLMESDPNPGILDFQDAVYGPISYDITSLFRDAFISWPPERVDGWLKQYWQQAKSAQLPVPENVDDFLEDCDLMGAQRHLKVIGIFARICHRDGKPKYLADVPRFFTYLEQVVARRPQLASLKTLLEQLPPFSL